MDVIGVYEALELAGGRIRDRPRLLALGLVGAAVSVGAVFAAGLLLQRFGLAGGSFRPGDAAYFRFLVAVTVVPVVVRGVAAGALVPFAFGGIRRDEGAGRERRGRRVRRSVVGATVTHAAGLALAAVALVAVLAVALPLATALQAAGYAYGLGVVEVNRWVLLWGAFGALFAAGAVATGALATVGPVLDRERAGYADAVRRSIRTAAADPRRALAHGVVVGLLVVWPYLVVVLLARVPGVAASDVGPAGLAVLVVTTGTGTYALAPVYRAAVAASLPPPVDAGAAGSTPEASGRLPGALRSLGGGRVGVVALVLSALLVGGVAVRVADVRPAAPSTTGGIDPGATGGEALRTGIEVTTHASVTVVSDTYRVYPGNDSRRLTRRWTARADPGDRQFEAYGVGRDDETDSYSAVAGYVSESSSAVVRPTPVSGPAGAVERLRSSPGSWSPQPRSVLARLELATAEGVSGSFSRLELEDAPADAWRIAVRTDERVVVETRPGSYAAVSVFAADRVVNGSVRVVLDADTGRIRRIEHRRTVRRFGPDDPPETRLTVTEYANYGSTDVSRPPALGPRGPVEYLYDALVY